MGTRRLAAKAKLFGASPEELQHIADVLRESFGRDVTISTIQPAREGDFLMYVTWWGSEAAA